VVGRVVGRLHLVVGRVVVRLEKKDESGLIGQPYYKIILHIKLFLSIYSVKPIFGFLK
jgi:hypothetical protein